MSSTTKPQAGVLSDVELEVIAIAFNRQPNNARALHYDTAIEFGRLVEAEVLRRSASGASQQAAQQAAEPVAWMWDEASYRVGDPRGRCWRPMTGRLHPGMPWMVRNLVPLYAHPPTPAPSTESGSKTP